MVNLTKSMRKAQNISVIIIFLIFSISCEWPFSTKLTGEVIFKLTVNHNIARIMPSAEVNLTWNEITVENFTMYKLERMKTKDTLWTSVVDLSEAFQLSYIDTIYDDEDLIYRIGIVDIEDNVRWAMASTNIPKTVSIIVPDELEHIQEAIESELMDDGDEILVKPGEYIERLTINSKNITVRSENGFQETIIRADTSGLFRVINISIGNLIGFTVTGGMVEKKSGGGIFLTGTGRIKNCLIIGNMAGYYGGGLYVGHQGAIYNSIISNNIGGKGGNGIFFNTANGEIINNTLVQNDIVINGDCTGLIIRNNIIYQSQPDISYTNSANQTGIIIDFNLLDENIYVGSDYINEDPEFLDNIDFRLSPTSPCIDAGHDDNQYLDIDGSRNDMGAYGGPGSGL